MRTRLFACALLLASCTKSGSLVSVTVEATTPLSDVAHLELLIAAGGRTQTTTLALTPASIPPQHSFGIDVGSGVTGTLTVTATAISSGGAQVGSASGSATIVRGGTANLTLSFGGATPADLSATTGDLSAPVDLASADLAYVPLVWTSQVIASGGSDFRAVWASDAAHVWLSGYDSISTFFSAGNDVWTQVQTNPFYNVNALWGSGATNAYMIDANGDVRILNSGGTAWGQGAQLANIPNLTAIWGSSASNVWLVSNGGNGASGGVVYHNTSGNNLVASWVQTTTNPSFGLNAIHGVAADNFTIVGDGGGIIQCDGVQYNYTQFGTGNLHGVWMADATHIYVVGDAGRIGFSSGSSTFTAQTPPSGTSTTNLYAVWASGPDDVYVVGQNATVLHTTGDGTWTQIANPLQANAAMHPLQAIWGTSARDIYAVSSGAGVLHGK